MAAPCVAVNARPLDVVKCQVAEQRRKVDRSVQPWANIRVMPNRVKAYAFSAWVCRKRNDAKHFFNKIKYLRDIATRYDKRATTLSHQPNSLQSAFGCEVMSGPPRAPVGLSLQGLPRNLAIGMDAREARRLHP